MTIIWSRTGSGSAADSIRAVSEALAEAERQQARAPIGDPFMGDTYLAEQVMALRQDWPVDVMGTLPASPGLGGRLFGAGQRLLRRATWWYMLPQWEQVNAFHGLSVRVIDSLLAGLSELRQRILLLEAGNVKLKTLEEQLGIAYERQVQMLEQIARLSAELEAIKSMKDES